MSRKGERVRAEIAPGVWMYGTVLHDSHGVEAFVRWDDGTSGLFMWASLTYCEAEADEVEEEPIQAKIIGYHNLVFGVHPEGRIYLKSEEHWPEDE